MEIWILVLYGVVASLMFGLIGFLAVTSEKLEPGDAGCLVLICSLFWPFCILAVIGMEIAQWFKERQIN